MEPCTECGEFTRAGICGKCRAAAVLRQHQVTDSPSEYQQRWRSTRREALTALIREWASAQGCVVCTHAKPEHMMAAPHWGYDGDSISTLINKAVSDDRMYKALEGFVPYCYNCYAAHFFPEHPWPVYDGTNRSTRTVAAARGVSEHRRRQLRAMKVDGRADSLRGVPSALS